MNNSGFFIGAVLIAFLVFITTRGELARYLELIGIGGGSSNYTPPKWIKK